MSKVTPFVLATAVLAGCASTREERLAAIQAELPKLVTACNGAFGDGSELVPIGIEACDRLARARSLDLADPAAAELYRRYSAEKTLREANRAAEAMSALKPGLGTPTVSYTPEGCQACAGSGSAPAK